MKKLLPLLFVFISFISVRAHDVPDNQQQPGQASSGSTKNQVTITVEGQNRVICSNGIPDHPTGQFPNAGNPNTIRAQNYTYTIPVTPQPNPQPTPIGMSPFGVALNGVVFDPGANEFWNHDRTSGWQYEALSGKINLGMDDNHAHVQPNGAYHYHGIPTSLVQKLSGGAKKLTLIGWAADGYPIYNAYGHTKPNDPTSPEKPLRASYQLKKGTRPSGPGGAYDGTFVADYEYVANSGDLDECNGTTGVAPEFGTGSYYYCVTENFPFIPRFYHGSPNPSFIRKGPPQNGQQGQRRGPPPGGPQGQQQGQHHGPPPGPPPGGQGQNDFQDGHPPDGNGPPPQQDGQQ